VTRIVKQTPGGIAYVELTYAKENNLPVALLRNQAGQFVEPTPAATTSAITAFAKDRSRDVRAPILDPPSAARGACPIAELTFLLIPKQGKNPSKTESLKQFVQCIITQGQDQAESLSYAELPSALQEPDQALLAQVGASRCAVS
jgi:phosphate transport system substrate-binding protein